MYKVSINDLKAKEYRVTEMVTEMIITLFTLKNYYNE